MHFIILGAPGSGKGTQAVRLAKKWSLLHISSGDLLRDAVAKQTPLGMQVQDVMATGQLVADEVVLELVAEALSVRQDDTGWILDGYPRTVKQAEALEDVLSRFRMAVDGVLVLDVDPEMIVERLSSRRTCVACRTVYNVLNNPPKEEGTCDHCAGEIIQREDDRPETIRERLRVYEEQTRPVIGFYETLYDVHRIDGTRAVEEVTKEIGQLIGP